MYPTKDSDSLAAILDAISEGVLPELDSKVCQESTACYEKEVVLQDFEEHLREVFEI